MKIIKIFDTTLRDGEQSPGATLNIKEKLEIARALTNLNVDIIEAGFPIVSKGDFEAVKLISHEIKTKTICGLARCRKEDIETCADALKVAKFPRIHTFIATSDIHLKYKLKKTKEEVLEQAIWGVKLAKKFVDDVEFSPEDAFRTNTTYLYQVLEAVIRVGATTVNIPDTVGYATPEEFGKFIKGIKENVSNIDKAMISVHCHNDLGLATSNTLMAVLNGALQVECTINGIGERAGNASLEEVVMAIKTRKNYFPVITKIKTEEIIKTSRMVSNLTGIVVQPNKAIVGANAFAHEAGIHQDGILKERTTYEIMTPQSIGLFDTKLVLGKHSGRHGVANKLKELGYKLSQIELNHIYEKFLELADKKKEIFDEDIELLVEDELYTIPKEYELVYIHTISGNKTVPTATIKIKRGDTVFEDAACGDGPVDATYNTIDRITKIKPKLVEYSIKAVTSGKDALGEVIIKVKYNNNIIIGRGSSTDIIEASALAYLNTINKIIYNEKK